MGKSYFCRFHSAQFVMSMHKKPAEILSMEFATFPASAEYICKLRKGKETSSYLYGPLDRPSIAGQSD
jgi:hypothetical protein